MTLVLALLLALSLSACDSRPGSTDPTSSGGGSSSPPMPAPFDATYWTAVRHESYNPSFGRTEVSAMPTEKWWADLYLNEDGTALFREALGFGYASYLINAEWWLGADNALRLTGEDLDGSFISMDGRKEKDGSVMLETPYGNRFYFEPAERPVSGGELCMADLEGTWRMSAGEVEGDEFSPEEMHMASLLNIERWWSDDEGGYREENREKAAQFRTTRSFGEDWKVLLDEDDRWFTVTRARDLAEANPDILDFDAITGCRMDIDESRTELTREDADGKDVSYVPPRYEYSYDFFLVISVRHPYFDEMRFSLNSSSVYYEPQKLPQRAPMSHAPMDRPSGRPKTINASRVDPEDCAEYRKYRQMGDEICQALEQARSGGKQPAGAAPEENAVMREAAQDIPAAGPWTCPACGGANTGKFCEYCGSPAPDSCPHGMNAVAAEMI